MEIKVQDYAASRGVSPEAIRKKIRRNPPELEGHVVRRNNATWLDDVAQAYLDEGLQRNYGEVSDGSWQREKEMMQATITAQAKRISELADWHAENAMKIAAADQTQLLLKAAEDDKTQLQTQLAEEKAAHKADKEDAAAALQAEQEEKLEAQGKQRAAENEAKDLREKLAATEAQLQAEHDKPFWQLVKERIGRKKKEG